MPFSLGQLMIICFIGSFVFVFLDWLFRDNGLDKIKNPKEWKDTGGAGERTVYLMLRDKFAIPEEWIFRNVYIPTKNGKTSEIDLLVVCEKGLIVFECKNYAGNIYGDREKQNWVQYVGNKKSYFYNPFLQNDTHVKNLRDFFRQYDGLPIIPFVSTIKRGKWKVKNLDDESDYLLGYNSRLKDILEVMPDSDLMLRNFDEIVEKLRPLERPSEEIRKKHIESITKKDTN